MPVAIAVVFDRPCPVPTLVGYGTWVVPTTIKVELTGIIGLCVGTAMEDSDVDELFDDNRVEMLEGAAGIVERVARVSDVDM